MNGILLMLCADVAFALMAAAMKSMGHRIPAAEVIFVRSLLSYIVLLALLKKSKVPLGGKEPGLLWARGLIGYVALQCYFWALPQIPLGTAVMLNYTAPLFAVLLSLVIFGEKPPLVVKVSLPLLFVGIYLLASPQFGGRPAALASGLASGILAGGVYVMINQTKKSDPPMLVVFYFTLSSLLCAGLLTLHAGWVTPTPWEWVCLLLVTGTSFVGQLFLTHSLQKAPVWQVSPFGYLTPVLGLVLGFLLWKEMPSLANLLGSAIVIACGVLILTRLRTAR